MRFAKFSHKIRTQLRSSFFQNSSNEPQPRDRQISVPPCIHLHQQRKQFDASFRKTVNGFLFMAGVMRLDDERMIPCWTSLCRRSAKIFDAIPSRDLVRSSRKCLRFMKRMSRMTSRLHGSPNISTIMFKTQADLWPLRTLPLLRLGFSSPEKIVQLVASRKWLWCQENTTSCHMQPVV